MRQGGGIHWNRRAKEFRNHLLGLPLSLDCCFFPISNEQPLVRKDDWLREQRYEARNTRGRQGRKKETKGKRARGQKEPSEIKNGHGDERRHFIILLEIIRVYFFCSFSPSYCFFFF